MLICVNNTSICAFDLCFWSRDGYRYYRRYRLQKKLQSTMEEKQMSRNKMDAINFSKIFDMFGADAARDTLKDVNSGRVRESTIEKYLYIDETKEEYAARLRAEYSDLE